MSKLSVLSWKLADYRRENEEAPERIEANPEACEGELMTKDEMEEYLADSMATTMVLINKGSPAAHRVKSMYLADLEFLVTLGRMSLDDYNDLSNEDNFRL